MHGCGIGISPDWHVHAPTPQNCHKRGAGLRAGLSAAELTAQNLDKSALLRAVVAAQPQGRWQQLLAEFQLGFVTFLFGQSLEGAPAVSWPAKSRHTRRMLSQCMRMRIHTYFLSGCGLPSESQVSGVGSCWPSLRRCRTSLIPVSYSVTATQGLRNGRTY